MIDRFHAGSQQAAMAIRKLLRPSRRLCVDCFRHAGRSALAGVFFLSGGCAPEPAVEPKPASLPEVSQPMRPAGAPSVREKPDEQPAVTYRDDFRAAQDALNRGQLDEALPRFQNIPLEYADIGREAARQSVRIFQSQGRLTEMMRTLSAMIERYPRDQAARQQLAELLAMVGRRSEAEVHVRKLAELGELTFEELVLLTDFDRRHPRYGNVLQHAESKSPDDLLVQLGLATEDFLMRDYVNARTRLNRVVAVHPNDAIAQGLLGEVLIEIQPDALPGWFENLPDELRDAWQVKFALGRWAESNGQREMAARCFRECLENNQTSYRLWFYLASVLTELNAPEAEAYRLRADQVHRLRTELSLVLNSGGRNLPAVRRMIELLHELDRQADELRWLQVAEKRHPADPWIREKLDAMVSQMRSAPRFEFANSSLATMPPLGDYPEFRRPDTHSVATLEPGSPPAANSSHSQILFVDQAAELGIELQFVMGRPDHVRDVRMFESTGGGVGVIDLDCDGLPDLFLTQGLPWPSGADEPQVSAGLSDQLFRNRMTRFDQVTDVCGLGGDVGYGQGCSVGDINNDGFPDLYVANIGTNRLLLNNGDGTFSDVTQSWGIEGNDWTTSCLIADIDGDLNVDLFDVNYLQGARVFRDSCSEHGCSTAPFDGAIDVAYWSAGDETFHRFRRDVEGSSGPGLGIVGFLEGSSTSGLPSGGIVEKDVRGVAEEPGAGPGVLADSSAQPLQKDGAAALTLFVGNDGKPDYLLHVESSGAAGSGTAPEWPILNDMGFLRGVAVNGDGKNTSTMGIAAGDLNRDGRLDFLVTNYSAEANSLFVQQEGGYFTDRINETTLRAPGIPFIGWGTQFIDFNCDGLLDVFVANGHVADFQEVGVEYRMPTQVFEQVAPWQFVLLTAEQVGPYFEEPRLGRAVASLDWNSDGRIDVVMGSIDSPVALLTNTTLDTGHWLSVRPVATASARDAFGTRVTVHCDSTDVTAQLTCGSGYQASNERLLYFGLGSTASRHCTVTIDWPSGHTDRLENVPLDATLTVREGQPNDWLSSGSAGLVTAQAQLRSSQ